MLPFSMDQDGPILHLNTPICHCEEFAVQHLHWWVCPYGPVVALPLLYSPDPGLPSVYSLNEPAMLWTNSKHLAAPSNNDNNVHEVGTPAMTFVLTNSLEVDAKSSQISLTDDEFIQYYTIDLDAANNRSVEAVNAGESKVSPKKAKKDKVAGDTKEDGESSSDGQDEGMCSEGGSQHPSLGVGFQGWSDNKGEDDIMAAVANIVAGLE